MPNWRKVIVSGSDATLTSVTATAGLTVTGSARITGSLVMTGPFNQGSASLASGLFSHVQGIAVTASGIYSHAEGYNTKASGPYSHAEGFLTVASGSYSHAEGFLTVASGESSHAEGYSTQAIGNYSHAEGNLTFTSFRNTTNIDSYSAVTNVVGALSSIEIQGFNYTTKYYPGVAVDVYDDGWGFLYSDNIVSSSFSSSNTYVYFSSIPLNTYIGYIVVISPGVNGNYAHSEGVNTIASGDASHAEGQSTLASGSYSHAEGANTNANGSYSHAEGFFTTTTGQFSHAEGSNTTATGDYSHAEGLYTVASGEYQHVQGQYNISSSAQSAFIVGNGTGNGALRSNLIFATGSKVQVTGSVIATAGFTGSLQGTATTASFVQNAVSSSFATTASFAVSSSRAVSSSFATTASVATILQTARTIGGVSFNGSANINLPGVNTTGNQSTSGNAGTATFATSAGTATTATFASSAGNSAIVAVYNSASAAAALANASVSKFYPVFVDAKTNDTHSFVYNTLYANSGSRSLEYIMGTNTLTVTSSFAISSSFALTASFTPNAIVTASVSSNTITFTKGNGTTFPITVNTGSGGGGGATSPGGSTTQIQYNNAGAFGGVPNLTWNGTTLNATGSFSGYFIPTHVSGSLSTVSANYTISNPGIYCFTATDEFMVYTINFPAPSSMPVGQTIMIINRDAYEIAYGGSYRPVLANGDEVNSYPGTTQTYLNIDGEWILVSNTK